jgi:hypothetical protein
MNSMDNNNQEQKIKNGEEKIMNAINSGEIKMIPRWRFVLNTAFMVSGGLLIFFIAIYLISFTIFSAEQTGVWFTPFFGGIGFYLFLKSMPWILVVLSIIFVIAFFSLVKKSSFVYEKPLVYSLIGVVAIVTVGGFLILYTHFHQEIFNLSRHGQVPVIGVIYQSFGPSRSGDIHRGIILSTTTSGFIFQDRSGETSTVIVKNTQKQFPVIGDDIVIFGDEDSSGTIIMQDFREVRN